MGRCLARKNVPTATETASHAIRLKLELVSNRQRSSPRKVVKESYELDSATAVRSSTSFVKCNQQNLSVVNVRFCYILTITVLQPVVPLLWLQHSSVRSTDR